VDFTEKQIAAECESAWGPDADRRHKRLIDIASVGSMFGGVSHQLPIARLTFPQTLLRLAQDRREQIIDDPPRACLDLANRLIGGFTTAVHPVIDDMVHLAAFTPTNNPESDAAFEAAFPMPRSEAPAVPLIEHGESAETADAQTRRLGRSRR
jgi:hypothetical protein